MHWLCCKRKKLTSLKREDGKRRWSRVCLLLNDSTKLSQFVGNCSTLILKVLFDDLFFCFFFFFFFFDSSHPKMNTCFLRIATFNVEWFFTEAPFPNLKLCDVPTKAKRLTTAISRLGPLDVLALQEVQSPVEVDVLVNEMKASNLGWSPVAICGQYASVRTGQRVAWLYNQDTIKLRASGTFDFERFTLIEKHLWLDVEWNHRSIRLVCLHLKVKGRKCHDMERYTIYCFII